MGQEFSISADWGTPKFILPWDTQISDIREAQMDETGSASLRNGQAEAANAGKFERWSTNIDPQNGAEEIQLNPLDPSDRQTKITPEGCIDAGSGRR
jgi:hypothetical protein